jgi:integrase
MAGRIADAIAKQAHQLAYCHTYAAHTNEAFAVLSGLLTIAADPRAQDQGACTTRATDTTTLTWDQFRLARSKLNLRDRIPLELDMTNALRRSELFAFRWKCFESPFLSPDDFIFANEVAGFLDTDNYRKRVLYKLARDLNLPKLTFQLIRRTIATLAQKKGSAKDVQGVLRHSRTSTCRRFQRAYKQPSINRVAWIKCSTPETGLSR